MRSLGLLAITCGGLLLPACAVLHSPVNATQTAKLANAHPEDLPLNPPKTAYVVEDEVIIPPRRTRRATASAGNTLIEPKRSAATEAGMPQNRRREMPGTARVNAAPIFARSTVPLSKYKIDQSTDTAALQTKQRILDALAESAAIPNDGAAVTVITRGDKAILFGTLADGTERKLVEDIARDNAKRVESHIMIIRE